MGTFLEKRYRDRERERENVWSTGPLHMAIYFAGRAITDICRIFRDYIET